MMMACLKLSELSYHTTVSILFCLKTLTHITVAGIDTIKIWAEK